MSVLIKDMEKPKFCYAVIDGEAEYCPFVNTDDDCVLLLKKDICEGTWEEQYSKCPLVPSVQPETDLQPTCNQLATDCISRKAALYAIRPLQTYKLSEDDDMFLVDKAEVQTELMMLPSAQPEIIHCKDCKWKQGAECVRFAEIRPFPDDFCSRGERRAYG